jgi:AcrR family transcriptional regulator
MTSRPSARHSAQGTRLNKRGIESRRRFLEAAISTLATDGPAAASANLIAKRAGVTWGTIQHQFGDVDGVWAAVFDNMREQLEAAEIVPPRRNASLRNRVGGLIRLLWEGSALADARAAENLRFALPRDLATLRSEYPLTDVAIRRFDDVWRSKWAELFAGMPVSPTRLRRVQSLLPAAMRGLRQEADLPGYGDPEEAVRGLTDAIVAYLEADAP